MSGKLCFAVCGMCQCLCLHFFKKPKQSHGAQLALLLCICCLASFSRTSMVLWEEERLRNIRFGFTSVLVKPWLCLLGFPLRITIPFMAFTSLCGFLAQGLVRFSLGPQPDIHAVLIGEIAMFVVSSTFAILQQGWISNVFHLQMSLEAEKAAMASLLNMVCDAVVWVAPDGASLTHSDSRFTSLVGSNKQNLAFLDHFCTEEQARVRNVFSKFVQSGEGDPTAPSALLHTCMDTASSSAEGIDLLIVDRREGFDRKIHDSMEPGKRTGFLVGIRLSSNHPVSGQPATASASFQQDPAHQIGGADVSIEFDAFDERLTLLDYGALIDFDVPDLEAVNMQPCGMLELMPQNIGKHFEQWVYHEVQSSPMAVPTQSTTEIYDLPLVLQGNYFLASLAWLEISNHERCVCRCIPVRLVLRGVRAVDEVEHPTLRLRIRNSAGLEDIPSQDDSVSNASLHSASRLTDGLRQRRWLSK
eukprot:gnl/TRDRNA2_/TRDRNA2_177761_c0_seq1.p1 gnl/TRDRNA2_/TRDRNA2_177761_c0~~gnl/TRDRNA2_/TRDRNA2_177761_c0_seq1.p1  ORF type:complete len:533 (+),score=25.49 gnl/TRDRNA2_/TRDRNA2_177761_c0_seq1:183-1601(+)